MVHAIYALEKLFLMRPIIQSVVQLALLVNFGEKQHTKPPVTLVIQRLKDWKPLLPKIVLPFVQVYE